MSDYWMLEFDGNMLPWTVCAALMAMCWAIMQLSRPGAPKAAAKDDEEDLSHLQVPPQPHLEIAMHPPQGMHWSNPAAPNRFDNDMCSGEYLFFHPPTDDAVPEAGLDYGNYFKGKTRIWELRVRFNFKQPPCPDRDLFFGTEGEDYVPLNAAMKQVLALCVGAVKTAVGGLYHTPGDDPRKMPEGAEVEKPGFLLPLWAFDQFIVTPEGEAPPDLMGTEFPKLGSKRCGRVKEYVREMTALRSNITAGPTYTFAFWGTSRFADIINWRLVGMPLVGPIQLDGFIGRPPLHCVLYELTPSTTGEKRHLNSRKRYFFRASIWSSLHRPPWKRIQEMTGRVLLKPPAEEGASSASKARSNSLRRRLEHFFGTAALSCCGGDVRSVRRTGARKGVL